MTQSRSARITLAAAGLGALLVLLNPAAERHREALREAAQERSALEGALGLGHLRAFVAEYHSLGLASYTTVGGDTATVGVGGLVFVVD